MRFSWTLWYACLVCEFCELEEKTYVGRSEDCAVPVGHQKIVAVVKSVGACLCLLSVSDQRAAAYSIHRTGTETLLSLLELLKQTEVARYLGAHDCCYVAMLLCGCAVGGCWEVG